MNDEQTIHQFGNMFTGQQKQFFQSMNRQIYQPTIGTPYTTKQNLLTDFQAGHGFIKQSGTGTQSDDTTTSVNGTQSLKLVTAGTSSACFTKKTISSTNLTGQNIAIWLKTDKPLNITELFCICQVITWLQTGTH